LNNGCLTSGSSPDILRKKGMHLPLQKSYLPFEAKYILNIRGKDKTYNASDILAVFFALLKTYSSHDNLGLITIPRMFSFETVRKLDSEI
jgi:hypothetical protein